MCSECEVFGGVLPVMNSPLKVAQPALHPGLLPRPASGLPDQEGCRRRSLLRGGPQHPRRRQSLFGIQCGNGQRALLWSQNLALPLGEPAQVTWYPPAGPASTSATRMREKPGNRVPSLMHSACCGTVAIPLPSVYAVSFPL